MPAMSSLKQIFIYTYWQLKIIHFVEYCNFVNGYKCSTLRHSHYFQCHLECLHCSLLHECCESSSSCVKYCVYFCKYNICPRSAVHGNAQMLYLSIQLHVKYWVCSMQDIICHFIQHSYNPLTIFINITSTEYYIHN